jgi:hypothetical protein
MLNLIDALDNGAQVGLTPQGVRHLAMTARENLGLSGSAAELDAKLGKFRGRIIHAPHEPLTHDGREASALVVATWPREIKGNLMVLPWGCLKLDAKVAALLPKFADARAAYMIDLLRRSAAPEVGEEVIEVDTGR